MRGILEPEHLLLILVTLLVMFGGKKIPELAGGIGKGVREFKKGLHDTGVSEPVPVAPVPVAPVPEALPVSTAAAPTTVSPDGPKRLLG